MKGPIHTVTAPLTNYMFSKSSRLKIPLSGTFELSPLCNFSCRMCYVRKTAGEVQAHERSPFSLEQWSTLAREARDAGMLFLLLTGGEPLLWPDFWRLYNELAGMGLAVSVNTNGSLIDADAVRQLRARPPRRVNITLYGAGDDTYQRLCGVNGVFSTIDRAITALREAGVTVKLNCSLTPQNAGDLEDVVRYARERELVLQTASYMFPPIRRDAAMVGQNERFSPEENAFYRMKAYHLQFGEEKYREWLRAIVEGIVLPPSLDESCEDPIDGKIRCRAGKASFWVTWDGWLTPCGMMPEPRLDAKEGTFAGNWGRLTEICDSVSTSGHCARCGNRELCHPCAAMALAETGEVGGTPDYLCQTVQAMKNIAHTQLQQL